MLETALSARIPILRATTSDPVNLFKVLSQLVPDEWPIAKYVDAKWGAATIFYTTEPTVVDADTYKSLAEKRKVLLLINQEDESGISLNVGEIPVPEELMLELVAAAVKSKTIAKKLMVAFKGLTLKAAAETISLVKTQGLPLNVENILRERSQIVGKLKGLALVDTMAACYLPDPDLAKWVAAEKPYFHGAADPRLVPRGLLFDGIAGTGKTAGAKHIAREFGVPLYRLDMASSLAKYVGESEANFGRVLSALDQEEPCVFLIDEVEKLFEAGGEDAGTTSRILSQLLWWLNEHRSRILTVMTTNDKSKLPPELYRQGRIDRVMTFGTLLNDQVWQLASALFATFGIPVTPALKKHMNLSLKMAYPDPNLTPAQVTQIVFDYLKESKACLSS